MTRYHDMIIADRIFNKTVFPTFLSEFFRQFVVGSNIPKKWVNILSSIFDLEWFNGTWIGAQYVFSFPQECICSLQYNEILVSCPHSKYTSLLLYPHKIETLYFYGNLHTIKSYAFSTKTDNNQTAQSNPDTFTGLNELRWLDLAYCQIAQLHAGAFTGLSKLWWVNILANQITQLHAGVFEGLIELQILMLRYNQIAQLDVGVFATLSKLCILNLHGNQIAQLPTPLFAGLHELYFLYLSDNQIVQLPVDIFAGVSKLKNLYLYHNQIAQLPASVFAGLSELRILYLSHNQLTDLPVGLFIPLCSLNSLLLDHNNLTTLPVNLFTTTKAKSEQKVAIADNSLTCSNKSYALPKLWRFELQNNKISQLPNGLLKLPSLYIMNLSSNQIDTIASHAFKLCPQLQLVDLSDNTLHWVTMMSFEGLSGTAHIHVSNYDSCCFIDLANCTSIQPRSPFLSCERLLINTGLMTVLWILGILCISSNLGVLYYRWKERRKGKQKERKLTIAVQSPAAQEAALVQFLLISNLTTSDLLMGIYMLILAYTDAYYMEYFPSHSDTWRQSAICITAGALAILSSECSVFLITLISVDRFLGIMFPLSDRRLRPKSAKIAISAMWFVALAITAVTLALSLKNTHAYAIPEVCIGLPIARYITYATQTLSTRLYSDTALSTGDINYSFSHVTGSEPSMYFSIALFTGLNLLCFLIVTFCYTAIFFEAKRSASSVNLTRAWKEELQMAIKMGAVVLTDLLCWMPVIILSILVQGKVVTISPVAYVWITTFVLPINSAFNPFLYTLAAAISERCKQRKKREDENIPMRVIG